MSPLNIGIDILRDKNIDLESFHSVNNFKLFIRKLS